MARAGLTAAVEIIQQRAGEVDRERPVSLLLIDGLHDYASVAQDFYPFERWLVPGGLVAFHDYAPYFPGVQAFVHELLGTGGYRKVQCVGSLMVLQKLAAEAPRQAAALERGDGAVEVRAAAAEAGGGLTSGAGVWSLQT